MSQGRLQRRGLIQAAARFPPHLLPQRYRAFTALKHAASKLRFQSGSTRQPHAPDNPCQATNFNRVTMTPNFFDHRTAPAAPLLKRGVCTARRGMVLVSLGVSAMISIAAHAQSAGAAGLNSLENFIKTTQSGRASFSQVVTSPSRDGQAPKIKTSTGSFEFLRPNRFKFIYKKPFEQSIVADGQTLWLYDVDLNQVTARKLAQVLNGTPAAVIAAAADLKGLQNDFTLTPLPEKSGLQWVEATPKTKEGQLQSIRVGFKAVENKGQQGTELAVLEILDSFGQKSVMTFSQFEVNPALNAANFQFKPPAGADVVRQ